LTLRSRYGWWWRGWEWGAGLVSLTNDPIRTLSDAWAVVLAYARRWQIEEIWRTSKSELASKAHGCRTGKSG
jgi:hypothetical protein